MHAHYIKNYYMYCTIVLFEMSYWNIIYSIFVQIYTLPSLLGKKEESKYPNTCFFQKSLFINIYGYNCYVQEV